MLKFFFTDKLNHHSKHLHFFNQYMYKTENPDVGNDQKDDRNIYRPENTRLPRIKEP